MVCLGMVFGASFGFGPGDSDFRISVLCSEVPFGFLLNIGSGSVRFIRGSVRIGCN